MKMLAATPGKDSAQNNIYERLRFLTLAYPSFLCREKSSSLLLYCHRSCTRAAVCFSFVVVVLF